MRNKSGSALIIVIMAFAVLMTLGTAVLAVSLAETKQVIHQEDRIKAHYAARSGAEAMASYLIGNQNQVLPVIAKTSSQPATGTINGKTFELSVSGTAQAPLITSKVYESGTEIASVKLSVKSMLVNLLEYAVFADTILSTGNNNTINGDIGTNALNIDLGNNATINGNIDLNANVTIPPIKSGLFTTPLTWNDGDANTLSNTGVTYYSINSFANNKEYKYAGTGEIHLLVTDAPSFNSSGGIFKLNATDNVFLYIYYNGTNKITFNGHSGSPIAIYAPNAEVEFNGGANGTYTGSIICKEYSGPNSNCTLSPDPGLNPNNMAVDSTYSLERNVYGK